MKKTSERRTDIEALVELKKTLSDEQREIAKIVLVAMSEKDSIPRVWIARAMLVFHYYP